MVDDRGTLARGKSLRWVGSVSSHGIDSRIAEGRAPADCPDPVVGTRQLANKRAARAAGGTEYHMQLVRHTVILRRPGVATGPGNEESRSVKTGRLWFERAIAQSTYCSGVTRKASGSCTPVAWFGQ